MKTFLCWLLVVFLLYSLQSSFLPVVYFHGIGPDTLLLLTASYAFIKGSRMGSFMGFMLGLFEDLATGGFFGIGILTKMLVGFTCGVFSNRVLRDSFILPVAAAFISTVATYFVSEILIFLLNYNTFPWVHITYKLLPMLVYNIVCAWPIYVLVTWLNDKLSPKK